MVRPQEYTRELADRVIFALRCGKTFRCVAAEYGVSLGMVQRIWQLRCDVVVTSDTDTDGVS